MFCWYSYGYADVPGPSRFMCEGLACEAYSCGAVIITQVKLMLSKLDCLKAISSNDVLVAAFFKQCLCTFIMVYITLFTISVIMYYVGDKTTSQYSLKLVTRLQNSVGVDRKTSMHRVL